MKAYFLAVLVAALVGLGSVAATNLAIDPSAVLIDYDQYSAGIAEAMLAGKSIVGNPNLTDRLIQREYIARVPTAPDAIVLGSSRAMEISGRDIGVPSTQNHGVSSASVQDLLAISEMYFKRGLLPHVVIISVDPTFLINDDHSSWWFTADEYFAMRRRLGLDPPGLSSVILARKRADLRALDARAEALLSEAYFRASIQKLAADGLSRDVPFEVTDERESETWLRRPDGTRGYPTAWREFTVSITESMARGERPPANLEGAPLDPEALAEFAALVYYLRGQGAEVVLLLLPYHPIISPLFYQYEVVPAAERSLHELSVQSGVPLVGTFDGRLAPCASGDYYESTHPRLRCIDRILAAWRSPN